MILDNGTKVLANADGLRLLRTLEDRSIDASRSASETVTKPLINPLTAGAVEAAAAGATSSELLLHQL